MATILFVIIVVRVFLCDVLTSGYTVGMLLEKIGIGYEKTRFSLVAGFSLWDAVWKGEYYFAALLMVIPTGLYLLGWNTAFLISMLVIFPIYLITECIFYGKLCKGFGKKESFVVYAMLFPGFATYTLATDESKWIGIEK